MKINTIISLIVLCLSTSLYGQSWKVIQSTPERLTMIVQNSPQKSESQINEIYFAIGLPTNDLPQIIINNQETSTYSLSEKYPLHYDPAGAIISWESLGKFRDLNVGVLKVIPFSGKNRHSLSLLTHIQFTILFKQSKFSPAKAGKFETALYRNRIVNWNVAKNWLDRPPSRQIIEPPIKYRFQYQPIVPDTLKDTTLQADYIIITPEEFLTVAEDLANYRTSEGINSIVATLGSIYDEFNESGDLETWVTIREFLKYTISDTGWQSPAPTFVLLLGDGPNPIPTYPKQSSFSSDSRFVYLNDGSNLPEMAIGRFPVETATEAENIVEKIIDYESDPEMGLWRQRITLIADDFKRPNPNDITHLTNNEYISNLIPQLLEVNKLYMEEFPEVNDGSTYGVSKPDATEALLDYLEQGTVLLNYIGHGSEYQWTQEGLLKPDHLSSINTGMKLPIWLIATCSWGKFDNPEGNAMCEDILRLPQNGAIAIISSIERITYGANEDFAIDMFENFFPSGNVTTGRLGIIFQTVQKGSDGNERFHLLGDPALKIALPSNTVSVDSVTPDSLVALSKGSYNGQTGIDAPDEGNGFAVLYDSDRRVYSLNSETDTIWYTLPGRTLFRGQISFQYGQYQGGFIIPKDVNYQTSDGRLTIYLYGENGNELWEGLGVRENLIFSGSAANPPDVDGPLISFNTETRDLEWGDHIDENSNIIIKISDPLGINVTGEIGHSISLWFDEDESNANNLTNLFVYDPGSDSSGTLDLPLLDIQTNQSLITIKAWDNANNPSQKSIKLNITAGTELILTNVFNYPNPFQTNTQFGFEVNKESSVKIRIYTLAGQLVTHLAPNELFYGYSHINWNGLDDFGDQIANGVYLYQLDAQSTDTDEKNTYIGKIAKYR